MTSWAGLSSLLYSFLWSRPLSRQNGFPSLAAVREVSVREVSGQQLRTQLPLASSCVQQKKEFRYNGTDLFSRQSVI